MKLQQHCYKNLKSHKLDLFKYGQVLKFEMVHTSLEKMRIKTINLMKTRQMHHFAYLEKRARARANLIRQPPENSLVGHCCISDEKPRPFKIILALAGALSASMF